MRVGWSSWVCIGLLLTQAVALGAHEAGPGAATEPWAVVDPVVVATFDTGTNPFHPCFRVPDRAHPADDVPGYPQGSSPINLTFGPTYEASLTASKDALDTIQPWTLHHIPGTKISFYGSHAARNELIDHHPHGSQASSQIACAEYGMGANAHLVVLNRYWHTGMFDALLEWVTAQDWIDIVHLNVQDLPLPFPEAPVVAISDLIASGKLVTIAAGNGVGGQYASYPMELSGYNGPPGSLIIGATDQNGYTAYSNLDPHIAADGGATRAAAPYGFDNASFSGTSSASPLATGYAAWVLGALRAEWGHNGTGLLSIPTDHPRPMAGPLADGFLSAAELHEVLRKTADPHLMPSRYDGDAGSFFVPPVHPPGSGAQYAKAGYGKVSEHTFLDAVRAASGEIPVPARSEDVHFAASETIRTTYWRDVWGV